MIRRFYLGKMFENVLINVFFYLKKIMDKAHDFGFRLLLLLLLLLLFGLHVIIYVAVCGPIAS